MNRTGRPVVREKARVNKQYEVRLTVVDERFFAARIDAGSDAARIDWRRDYDSLSYEVISELPADVCAGVRRLMRSFGLRFAAMDFIVDPAGTRHFLDLNPNGQWAWIEDATGLPITAALADALTSGTNL